jgi:hypothetical protein
MHVFGLILLFGLGILAIERFFDRWLSIVPEAWALLGVALGIVLAWVVGFDLFKDWALPARAGWVGVTMSGIILGGVADVWHYMLHLFSGVTRKVNDEAKTMEQRESLRAA